MMVSRILILVSLQLLYVHSVPPRRAENDILDAFRNKFTINEDKVLKEESTASHGQTPVIKTILNQLLPNSINGGELKQISSSEFAKLFGNAKRQLRIQNENGKDTGIQYDFIPHIESESVPESATYTFFLRTGKPQLFLFDDDSEDSLEHLIEKERSGKNENFDNRPKIILPSLNEDINEITDNSGEIGKDNLNFKDNNSTMPQSEDQNPTNEEILAKFPKQSKLKNKSHIKNQKQFDEEERVSKTTNAHHSRLNTVDISSLLDDSREKEDFNEIDSDLEFSTIKLDLTSVALTLNKITGQRQLEGKLQETTTSISPSESTVEPDQGDFTESGDASTRNVESFTNKNVDDTTLEEDLTTVSFNDLNEDQETSTLDSLKTSTVIDNEEEEALFMSNIEILKIPKKNFSQEEKAKKENEQNITDLNSEEKKVQNFNRGAVESNPGTKDDTKVLQMHINDTNELKDKEEKQVDAQSQFLNENDIKNVASVKIHNEETNSLSPLEIPSDKPEINTEHSFEDQERNIDETTYNSVIAFQEAENQIETNITSKDIVEENKINHTIKSNFTNPSSNHDDLIKQVLEIANKMNGSLSEASTGNFTSDKNSDSVAVVTENPKENPNNETNNTTVEESTQSRNPSWFKAIPFLAYWIVDYIRSDPKLTVGGPLGKEEEIVTQAINDNISEAVEQFRNGNGKIDPDLNQGSQEITNTLLNIAKHNRFDVDLININDIKTFVNEGEGEDTFEENISGSDSVHGDTVNRNSERKQNKNFNNFADKPNACDCKHGGECLPESKSCYCSHGFTGAKCQKRIRKALVVGGLRDVQIRLDSELVGGLEVRRCSPPPYPRPIIAATGQTSEDMVVVCGGATQIGGKLTPTDKCHTWRKTNNWSSPFRMSSSRAWAASVLIPTKNDDQMIVIGGVDQNNVTLDSIEVVDIKARTSTKIGLTLPTPLAGHCAVQLNSTHTFVAGGAVTGLAGFSGPSNFSKKAWFLSEVGWTEAGEMAQARSVHSCSTVLSRDGKMEIMVVGGIGMSNVGTRMVLDSVEIYSIQTGKWRKGNKLPLPVFGGGLLELAGQPMLIGGRYQENDRLRQSDSSYMYQNSWRSSTLKMRSPRDLAVTVAAPSFC